MGSRNIAQVIMRQATVAALMLAAMSGANAMDFTWSNKHTVLASGEISEGDAVKFAALAKFDTLELESPGGLVGEALAIAANMDKRGGIRTVVKTDGSCASACAMAVFVSGETRIVYMGGRLGIHSCRNPDGTPALECNKTMAANAVQHGVPWGVIEGFGKYTKSSSMMWLGAEDAECWGLMKWSAKDPSNNGIDCFKWGSHILTDDLTAANASDADYVICRANAGTSRTYISSDRDGQGFSEFYRKACERIVADSTTPKYAAIDILMWLALTDPNILKLNPGTLTANILSQDIKQINNCWKCLTIIAMSMLMHEHPNEAMPAFARAVAVVKQNTGSVPEWLASRIDMAAAAVKRN